MNSYSYIFECLHNFFRNYGRANRDQASTAISFMSAVETVNIFIILNYSNFTYKYAFCILVFVIFVFINYISLYKKKEKFILLYKDKEKTIGTTIFFLYFFLSLILLKLST